MDLVKDCKDIGLNDGLGKKEYGRNISKGMSSCKDEILNYRMGIEKYEMDFPYSAKKHFETALKIKPYSAKTVDMINLCLEKMSCPRQIKPFRNRAKEAWMEFKLLEAGFRRDLNDINKEAQAREKIKSIFQKAVEGAKIYVENTNEKPEIVFSADGVFSNIISLVYLKRLAGFEIEKNWDITVGKKRMSNRDTFEYMGEKIKFSDVVLWWQINDENSINVILYCEKLSKLKIGKNQITEIISKMLDSSLGEIASYAYLNEFTVISDLENELDRDKKLKSCLLSEFVTELENMRFDLLIDAEEIVENRYIKYFKDIDKYEDYVLHGDCRAGVTSFSALLNEYLSPNSKDRIMENYISIGAVPMFFVIDSRKFDDYDQMIRFTDRFTEAIYQNAGENSMTETGRHLGRFCVYIDVIAWDFNAVLLAANEFLVKNDIKNALVQTFFKSADAVAVGKN